MLPSEIFWPYLFTIFLFLNISGVIFTNMEYRYMTKALNLLSWEFRIREIRYCWEGNTILLRGKYDVLINVTWDCFDQSNFCTSRINIIEWNNKTYFIECWIRMDVIVHIKCTAKKKSIWNWKVILCAFF
jgi:hypothetical protein